MERESRAGQSAVVPTRAAPRDPFFDLALLGPLGGSLCSLAFAALARDDVETGPLVTWLATALVVSAGLMALSIAENRAAAPTIGRPLFVGYLLLGLLFGLIPLLNFDEFDSGEYRLLCLVVAFAVTAGAVGARGEVLRAGFGLTLALWPPLIVLLAVAGELIAAFACLLFVALVGFAMLHNHRSVKELVHLRLRADEQADRLRVLSETDSLTGLANRSRMMQDLEAPSDRSRLLFFIDLDHFKTVNDRGGHLLGDAVLIAMANRLSRAAPDGSLVARLGGDEFLILVTADAVPEPIRFGNELIQSLEIPIVAGDESVAISASVGVAELLPGQVRQSLQHADSALYESKRRGRGLVVQHDPGEAPVRAQPDSPKDRRSLKRTPPEE